MCTTASVNKGSKTADAAISNQFAVFATLSLSTRGLSANATATADTARGGIHRAPIFAGIKSESIMIHSNAN